MGCADGAWATRRRPLGRAAPCRGWTRSRLVAWRWRAAAVGRPGRPPGRPSCRPTAVLPRPAPPAGARAPCGLPWWVGWASQPAWPERPTCDPAGDAGGRAGDRGGSRRARQAGSGQRGVCKCKCAGGTPLPLWIARGQPAPAVREAAAGGQQGGPRPAAPGPHQMAQSHRERQGLAHKGAPFVTLGSAAPKARPQRCMTPGRRPA